MCSGGQFLYLLISFRLDSGFLIVISGILSFQES